MSSSKQHWLMKAEPEARLEKGVDVAFSVDHFEKVKTTTWDGVRNPEAKTIMKEKMKLGDEVLFYHSNCVAGLAEVSKEGYPDHTAWDPKHPYFDPKTDQANPKWFMVNCTFKSRLSHFVPLALLQHISSASLTSDQKKDVAFLSPDHIKAIGSMALLNRGRLSVQPVTPLAYEAIALLGDKGGFTEWPGKWNKKGGKAQSKRKAEDEPVPTSKPQSKAPADENDAPSKAKSAPKKAKTSTKEADTTKSSTTAKNAKVEEKAPSRTGGRRSARLQQPGEK
ncbi:hypothetical protein OC846_005509 [Tilletia horrida]|uniref:EVE domain-containing protein n=1 Tax=Tilletia horrida TaxID=155126 RepID=A0AAN6JPG1_9BASI|nr:hypothetical protein OC846_005509 [Tilletia horrida]KAK0560825.1 hypothetical protein OC861_006106 [Tilletia horrida]